MTNPTGGFALAADGTSTTANAFDGQNQASVVTSFHVYKSGRLCLETHFATPTQKVSYTLQPRIYVGDVPDTVLAERQRRCRRQDGDEPTWHRGG